jgi:hypothetical protein
MSDNRYRPFAGLIACAVIVVLLALYVIGFFALGEDATAFIGARQFRVRVYPYQWQATIFRPLASLESIFAGEEIDTAHRGINLVPNP